MDTLPSKVSRAPSCIVNDTEQNGHVRCRTCCRPWMWADGFRSATCRSFFHCSLLQLKVCVRARVRQGRGGGGERCVLSRDQPARPPCSRSGSLCCGCSASVSRSAPLSSVTDRFVCGARQTAGSSRCSSVCLKIEARTQGEDAPCPDELDRLPDFLNADPASVTRTFLHLPPSALSVSGAQCEPAPACCTRD